MKKRILPLLLILSLSMLSCEKDSVEKPVTADDLSFQVSFDQSFENTLYPSIILGLANYAAKENESFELIQYNLKTPRNNSTIKIDLSQSTINNETVFQRTLNNKGAEQSFFPKINWNYDNLRSMDQPGNVDLSFSGYVNGEFVDNQSLRLSYRSVNECVFGYFDEDGEFVDLYWMFGAYVNEDHPLIDGVLKDVLNTNLVELLSGYQGGTEMSVIKQVHAIWYTLQSKNVKYSSITNTSNPSDRVFTQHVRFFDEVYNNAQANCVDGSVFLSSILKKIDIKPFLVLEPGHMYMGFYTDKDKSNFQLIETTMIGHINLSEIYEDDTHVYNLDKYGEYFTIDTYYAYMDGLVSLEELKKEISWNHFIEVLNTNNDKWNASISKFNDDDEYQYQVMDIDELRKVVQPIGR